MICSEMFNDSKDTEIYAKVAGFRSTAHLISPYTYLVNSHLQCNPPQTTLCIREKQSSPRSIREALDLLVRPHACGPADPEPGCRQPQNVMDRNHIDIDRLTYTTDHCSRMRHLTEHIPLGKMAKMKSIACKRSCSRLWNGRSADP